jgi:DnaJ-class molecular chaperone
MRMRIMQRQDNRARIVEKNTLGRTLKRKDRGRQTISCFASDATTGERMKRTLYTTQPTQICPDCHGNGYIKLKFEAEEVIEQCGTCDSQGEVVEETG